MRPAAGTVQSRSFRVSVVFLDTKEYVVFVFCFFPGNGHPSALLLARLPLARADLWVWFYFRYILHLDACLHAHGRRGEVWQRHLVEVFAPSQKARASSVLCVHFSPEQGLEWGGTVTFGGGDEPRMTLALP